MSIKTFFLVSLIGVGFTACNDSQVDEVSGVEGESTYMNLSIELPGRKLSKALPGDYNGAGTYEGKDTLQTLDIYVKSSGGEIDAKRFMGSDISYSGTIISPSQPFRTTAGNKVIYVVVNSSDPLKTGTINEQELIPIAGLAGIVTKDSEEYDLITMTGKSGDVVIKPNVPIQDVSKGENKVAISVTRVVSRVIVTTSAATKDLYDDGGQKIGSVSDINYSVAQGTKKIYWMGQADYTTFGSDYITADGSYVGQADTYYDYSGLSVKNSIPVVATGATDYKSLKGQFLFENVHKEGTIDDTEYRKGNTAYVLVRAKFTPDPAAIADGGTLTDGTFYVGQSDGKIYSSKSEAQTAVANQKVATYVEGKMLNYAWLNPDDLTTPLNSPVVRNHIYHINITGFKRLGYNWNPLFPENPDPKPGTEEPEIPIDPTDPLSPEQTNMSVEVTVLDWAVHSYDIEF